MEKAVEVLVGKAEVEVEQIASFVSTSASYLCGKNVNSPTNPLHIYVVSREGA